MPAIESLSDETRSHWGLLTSPFSVFTSLQRLVDQDSDKPSDPEFYFRSSSHARLWNWIYEQLSRPQLVLLRSQIGSGVMMALRQISLTQGFNDMPIQSTAVQWQHQSVDGLGEHLADVCNQALGVRALFCVHAFRPTQVTQLLGWLQRNERRVDNATVLIRIEDHPATRNTITGLPTFTLHRTEIDQMQRCVQASLMHAGQTAPIFTDPAIESLVHLADGSFHDLAQRTHAMLSWAHAHRFDIISESVVRQYKAYHHKRVEVWRHRHAA